MKLIVGLGNPGTEYIWTRHNAGWLIIDAIAQQLHLGMPRNKFSGAFWGPLEIEGTRVLLLKPETFMNRSGISINSVYQYYNLESEDVLIVYDDVALPFGRLRIRDKGSAGGQKGMLSALQALGTQSISRLRIGVGSPRPDVDMARWVLANFNADQKKQWGLIEEAALDAIRCWIKDGVQAAMSRINGKNVVA